MSPALFAKDVIAGMFITQGMAEGGLEAPRNIMLINDTEAVVELSMRTSMDKTIVLMAALEYWLGQKVSLICRPATLEEVGRARAKEDEHERESIPEPQEAKFVRMMEDIHKLAAGPGGKALRIPTFSGVTPTPKKEATFV